MKNRSPAKINIPMCAACILLCLTLISIHLTGGLYARYTTSDTMSGSARVASFSVTEDRTSFDTELVIDIAPGTQEETIHIENDSEVAIRYTITVTNTTKNLPLKFQVGDSETSEDICTASWYMSDHSQADRTLKVIWDDPDALEDMGRVDLVTLSLKAEQVD